MSNYMLSGTFNYGRGHQNIFQNEDEWTPVVLAHSYANQQTMLIVDGSLVGIVNEQLSPSQFYFGGDSKSIDMKDLTLHRSCVNTDEALDLYNMTLIKASLEYYAPLTMPEICNLAQSMTVAKMSKEVLFEFQEVVKRVLTLPPC